jgi:hypothetical protein
MVAGRGTNRDFGTRREHQRGERPVRWTAAASKRLDPSRGERATFIREIAAKISARHVVELLRYENGNLSVTVNNGSGANCALSFKFN